MIPRSTASAETLIDATQRRLIVGIVMVTLMAGAIVIADLAIGGRPDPPTLRAAATLFDGSWRFHIGATHTGQTPVQTITVGRRSI
jgi:hypothetical protein